MPLADSVVSLHSIVRQFYPLPALIIEAKDFDVLSFLAVVRLPGGAKA